MKQIYFISLLSNNKNFLNNLLMSILFASASQILLANDNCFQQGQCTDSFHLSSDYTTDEYACLENCNDDLLCNWFTFSPTQSICELLHNCSAIDVPSCPGCLTGQTDCTPGNRSTKHS